MNGCGCIPIKLDEIAGRLIWPPGHTMPTPSAIWSKVPTKEIKS